MHFNKSPHASEHIYYSFSGTVEPGEIGAAESTGTALCDERGCGGRAGDRGLVRNLLGGVGSAWVLQLATI